MITVHPKDTIIHYQEILDFWFDPAHVPFHFANSKEFDQKIEDLFLETWQQGAQGLLYPWRETISGRLAEIIVLDQFSRNLWRGDGRSFAQDQMAVILAQEAVVHKNYEVLPKERKRFILMPFMHSEILEIHRAFRPYFEALEEDLTLEFEKKHYQVLEDFGRYPTRNQALGRPSTEEEKKILEERNGKLW